MNELALPIAIPLTVAASSVLLRKRPRAQIVLNLCGAVMLLASTVFIMMGVLESGVVTLNVGGWPAPFGITLVADRLAAALLLVTGVIALAVTVYSVRSVDHRGHGGVFFPLVQVLLMGVCGAFITGDLFNLYVCFEVMLMGSFALLCLGGTRDQLEGGIKYVTLNLLSSALFLVGTGVLYGVVGTLNMADLSLKLSALDDPALSTALAALFFVAFGIKAGAFPLFFWLPASYHTPNPVVSALFAGLLTKVGVYALIRTFTLLFVQDSELTSTVLLIVAGLTMLTGVFGAMAQRNFRRILSFHIVSQIGYMLMGLALLSPLALAGTVFYLVHHIIVKTNLFLVSGVARRAFGSDDLDDSGGLFESAPLFSLLFAIPALSLAGLPPLSGFFAKLALVRAAFERGSYGIVAVALVVSLFTLVSMVKIWNEAFWKPAKSTTPRPRGPWMLAPIAGMAALTVAIGLFAGPVFEFAQGAAEHLLDRRTYITAVMGPGS